MNTDRFTAEFRADVAGNKLTGHAAVFNQRAMIRDFAEQIDPRAFDRALSEAQDVVLLVNHDGLPLARTASGTLRLAKADRGLAMSADLPNTTLAADVRELTRRGDLRSMSFGFFVREDEWSNLDDGTQLRTVLDVDLFDVSVVTFPAYAGTDLALRNRPPMHTKPKPIPAWDEAVRIRTRIRGTGK